MILGAALLGIVLALLRGGRFSYLSHKRIRLPVLLFVSLGCEILAANNGATWIARTLARLVGIPLDAPAYLTEAFGRAAWLATPAAPEFFLFLLALLQYTTVLIFIVRNIRLAGMELFLIGSMMNGAVILVNGGRMPVSTLLKSFGPEALERIAAAPHYLFAKGSEPLVFLGDWLPFWSFGWYMVSIGDFFISLGVIFLVNSLMQAQTLTVFRGSKVESGADYIYTKERSINNKRGMINHGLYSNDFRQSENRQKDNSSAGINRSAHDRSCFLSTQRGDRQYHSNRKQDGN
ncbi:MAG: DUF5317 domain-containing protein [Saccharofermentanales bacterium]